MSTRANVRSIQELQEFKAALATFAQIAQGALVSADMEGRGFWDWLMDDQMKEWLRESRRREDQMTQAKIELTRCRASKVFDHTPSCIDELVALKKATAYWEAAQAKIQAVKRWDGLMREAITEFHGNTKALTQVVEIDLPRALALLDKLTSQLEEYVSIGSSAASREYYASQGITADDAPKAAEQASAEPASPASTSAEGGEQP